MHQGREPTLVQERIATDFPFGIPLTYAVDQDAINRKEILRVLERAANDNNFIALLTYHGSAALKDYDLTGEEKAALISGDEGWLRAHIGELDTRAQIWLNCRLQQENW